jgi:hypothetical protein
VGRPFKLGGTEAGSNGPGRSPEPLNPAETSKRAVAGGKTLIEAGAELRTPDGEVGGLPEEGDGGDGARPESPPAIPWPAARPVARKPFKL